MRTITKTLALAVVWIVVGIFGDRILRAQPNNPSVGISFGSNGNETVSFPPGTSSNFTLDLNPDQTIVWPVGFTPPPPETVGLPDPNPPISINFPNGGSVTFSACNKRVRVNSAALSARTSPKLAR